jgi:hypothetical protein
MKDQGTLRARRQIVEKSIKEIKDRASKLEIVAHPDGTICTSAPIGALDLKKMASLENELRRIEAVLGPRKPSTKRSGTPAHQLSQAMPTELLTEQMLADRWHCSRSRLQRWRVEGIGLAYLKIGAKVLYRLEDVRAYELSSLVQTKPA